jgi:peptidoglycan/xylan/chitin deacetylase (PgdA/CDA1 family)
MRKYFKGIYGSIRKIMPDSLKGTLNKFIFDYSGKPIVKKDLITANEKFPNNEKGGLIISADFEMAWAWRYTKTGSDPVKKGQIERANFPKIIKVLEEYNIPITFAIVGHLFLNNCQKGDHDWMQRISHFNNHWKFTHGDWYDQDPYSDYKKAPEWYAPDLIQMIIDSEVNHEIGSHTFSHIDFSDKNCSKQVAEDEIKACIEAIKPYNRYVESIVFPGGTWGNIEVLKEYNLKIYRKKNDFDLAYPYRDNHGILVSTSSGSLEFNKLYGWSIEYFLQRLKKIINRAIDTNTIAHLWFHPSLDPFFLEYLFPKFFHFISQEREKGKLWIGPMNKIAEHINNKKLL